MALARAGTVPSQICYETLNELLDPAGVRQDHLFMSRTVDAEGHVSSMDVGHSGALLETLRTLADATMLRGFSEELLTEMRGCRGRSRSR